jgi:crotonobetainyl-CoA:carnitine CoA-transferase CaiB-like acyl-CoA transferase
MLLADLGADVVVVHTPGGGPSPADPGRHVWDRGKRSALADPAAAADRAALGRLVAGADIVLVGTTRPGLSYADLGPRGPASWVVMPPYLLDETPWVAGADPAGPLFAWLGHAWGQSSYDDVPVDCLFALVPYLQGIWAAAVAAALIAGRRRGLRPGRVTVVGGAHGGVIASPGALTVERDEPHVLRPGGPGGALPNYRCYRCRDGTWLFLGAFTNAFIERALRAVGAGHVLDDPRIGGQPANVRLRANIGWITEELTRLLRERTRDEWIAVLEAADVPVAPALADGDWLDHPQVRAMGLRTLVRNDAGDEVVMPGPFLGMSRTPVTPRWAAPTRHRPVAEVAAGWPPLAAAEAEAELGPAADRPLDGLRVLDLGTMIAGPFLATLLGELGADVVKVERPPSGDEFRTAHAGRSLGSSFPAYNRDKRSLLIDLAHGGRDAFDAIAGTADVVVDNYRPGVLPRLGLNYERLAEINPGVTSVSVSAFGETGPRARRPGFDPIVQAMSGMMRAQGGRDEADSPVFLTVPVNDVVAAALGALGACAALAARERIGQGQRVSVTLCAAACLVQSERLVRFPGRLPVPDGGRDFAGPDPVNRLYRAADGWVRLTGRWPEDLPALVRAGLTGAGETGAGAADGNADAAGAADRVAAGVAAVVAGLPVAEVVRRAAGAGLGAVRARQARDVAADEQMLRHGLLAVTGRDDAGPVHLGPGRWYEMPGLLRSPPGAAPQPGQHTRALLAEAGLDPVEVARLEQTGVINGDGEPSGRHG